MAAITGVVNEHGLPAAKAVFDQRGQSKLTTKSRSGTDR